MGDETHGTPQDVVGEPTGAVAGAVADGLRIAAQLIAAGIPVFAAPPCPAGPFGQGGGTCDRPGHAGGGQEYDLPSKWQMTIPAAVWLQRWQPGWALAAVGGHAGDFLDEDPRNGGTPSVDEMRGAGHWPTVFGVASTPSGGSHYLISPIGERKVTGLLPGLDYQGGGSDGQGRGFVWIAPTLRRSKVDAVVRAYRWAQEPDLEWLSDFPQGDDSVDGVRLRIASYRARRTEKTGEARARSGSEGRSFTLTQMRHFVEPVIERVRSARVGEIEERANDLACTLSHFVPQMIGEDQAYDVLLAALGDTAYDPSHPASGWEADKFRAVLAGQVGRAPGDWHAELTPETPEEAVAAVAMDGDEVSALLAEMVDMDTLAARTVPAYMIKGLLSYDSETWLIGGPGSKKSFTVLDMAGHVATGRPWQGRRVNPGVVVMIVGEGAGSAGKRVAAWCKRNGSIPPDRMRALPRPVQAKDLGAWAVLVQACARLRASIDPRLGMFIVVDTQARSTIGLDENKADEMGVYIKALNMLREATGACVMSVHHTTKAGEVTRGSGALDGAQDTRLLMRSRAGTLDAELISDKQKDIEQASPIALRFEKVELGLDGDGDPITSLVLMEHDAWAAGGVTGEMLGALDQEAARAVNPFTVRSTPENWTHRRTDPKAGLQRWLLQALADTAEERGLTQSEWRGVVEEKIGKQSATAWRKAFQVTTGLKFDGLICKVHGADRWVVDRLVIEAEGSGL